MNKREVVILDPDQFTASFKKQLEKLPEKDRVEVINQALEIVRNEIQKREELPHSKSA